MQANTVVHVGNVHPQLVHAGAWFAGLATALLLFGCRTTSPTPTTSAAPVPDAALQSMCKAESLQAMAAKLSSTTVSVVQISNGPFPSAVRFVAASTQLPAYCQVTGSFVTNPKTGKTANFLASFPANWNGKYLQLGCSGHCGQFYVSNPATPSVVVTAQGHPGQIIEKGYATFATDEGHASFDPASWAVRKDGSVDQDHLDDFYYRADRVLADMGKELTTAFYASATGASRKITRSYFNGCSGGGRDAMVVASYFPEAFDGIIAGSPYDILGMGIHNSGSDLAMAQLRANRVSPALFSYMDGIVKAQCDGLDGVKDGVIQNPLACNFRPDRDLPRCEGDTPGPQCFTRAQVNAISTMVTAATDESGNVIQPGFSVSELQSGAGIGSLGAAVQKVFVHKNDPGFDVASNYTFKDGGPGPVNAYRVVFSAAEVARIKAELRLGEGHLLENSQQLMNSKTKLMIWHNWSDERLTPLSSINWYAGLAQKHGGYARVQQQARLFMLPATAHCSITGNGPNAFDALSAMESWVEHGKAPDALRLTVANHQFTPGASPAPALLHPDWTATMCKFPEMAHYSGQGDVKDAANWTCPADDQRMLQVGESGRQGGVASMTAAVVVASAGMPDNLEPGKQGETMPGEAKVLDRPYSKGVRLIGNTRIADNRAASMAWVDSCAYVPGNNGVNVIDVRDPHAPKVVGMLTEKGAVGAGETVHAISTRGRKLLAASVYGVQGPKTGGPGQDFKPGDAMIAIYDVSNCTQPKLVLEYAWPDRVHTIRLSPNGRRLYGTYISPFTGEGGIQVLDISDLKQPHYLGRLGATRPDGSTFEFAPHEVTVSPDERRIYAGVIASKGGDLNPGIKIWPPNKDGLGPEAGGIYILDNSDIATGKPNPQLRLLGTSLHGGWHTAMQANINGVPHLVGSGELLPCPGTWPRITNIADEKHPRIVGHFRLEMNQPENCPPPPPGSNGVTSPSGTATIHWSDVDDASQTRLGLFTMTWAGLRIVDIRNPANPVEVAYFKPGDSCMSHTRYVKETGQIWFVCGQSGFHVLDLKPELRKALGFPAVRPN